jgi:hypothetical protein
LQHAEGERAEERDRDKEREIKHRILRKRMGKSRER